jgi:Tol biopolymer transport system component
LNFNVMRYDQTNLSSSTNLGNIGGGLKFVNTISNDGQWLVANSCGCYSECGSESVWHLPTLNQISPPFSFQIGAIDFSPDSSRTVFGQWQMYGYEESALYTAGSNLSSPITIYNRSDTAPIRQEWSPDGSMIAFTLVEIDPVQRTATEHMVILISPDGHEQLLVESGNAEFLAWSPDSSRILYSREFGGVRQVYVYDRVSETRTLLPFVIDAYSDSAVDWGRLSIGDLGL